jgi:hypothetical protein
MRPDDERQTFGEQIIRLTRRPVLAQRRFCLPTRKCIRSPHWRCQYRRRCATGFCGWSPASSPPIRNCAAPASCIASPWKCSAIFCKTGRSLSVPAANIPARRLVDVRGDGGDRILTLTHKESPPLFCGGHKTSAQTFFQHALVARAKRSPTMFRVVVKEAMALTSLALFLGMIAIWVQVIATPEPARSTTQIVFAVPA